MIYILFVHKDWASSSIELNKFWWNRFFISLLFLLLHEIHLVSPPSRFLQFNYNTNFVFLNFMPSSALQSDLLNDTIHGIINNTYHTIIFMNNWNDLKLLVLYTLFCYPPSSFYILYRITEEFVKCLKTIHTIWNFLWHLLQFIWAFERKKEE